MINQDKNKLQDFFEEVFTLKKPMGNNYLPKSKIVLPCYRQGIHAGYIRTGEDKVVMQDNIPLGRLLVNKEFHEVGTPIIYGQHAFQFADALNALWWCKHIGKHNFSNVRILSISMESGWDRPVDRIDDIDLCHEEMWHKFLTWLKSNHQLREMTIRLSSWPPVQAAFPARYRDRQYELETWRTRLRTILYAFRGLKHAAIIDVHGYGMSRGECGEYSMMMIQDRLSVLPPPPKIKMSLKQLLEQAQMDRAMADTVRKREEGKAQRKERKRLMEAEEPEDQYFYDLTGRAPDDYEDRAPPRFGTSRAQQDQRNKEFFGDVLGARGQIQRDFGRGKGQYGTYSKKFRRPRLSWLFES